MKAVNFEFCTKKQVTKSLIFLQFEALQGFTSLTLSNYTRESVNYAIADGKIFQPKIILSCLSNKHTSCCINYFSSSEKICCCLPTINKACKGRRVQINLVFGRSEKSQMFFCYFHSRRFRFELTKTSVELEGKIENSVFF